MTSQFDLLTVTNTLIGLIRGDAGTRTGKNGSAFATFSVANKTSWKNSDGDWKSRT